VIVLDRPNAFGLFFTLKGSVLPRIATSVIACTVLAILVTLTHGLLFSWKVTLTPVPFTLIGLALAIFLGFRNGAAYERFWEARKLWGELIHRARTLARQQSWVAPPLSGNAQERGVVIRRTIAFAHALRCQLRGLDARDEMSKWLHPEEHAAWAASRSGANYLLNRNAEDFAQWVREERLPAPIAAQLDRSLAALGAVQAGCERIASTPIPFAYTLLLHRTAYLYCILLPFGLVDVIGIMTPVVVAIVCYTFFGLDALGDEIEQPFGMRAHHLPLDALCRIIEINLLDVAGERELPQALEPTDGELH
jgi:putative membrane protein